MQSEIPPIYYVSWLVIPPLMSWLVVWFLSVERNDPSDWTGYQAPFFNCTRNDLYSVYALSTLSTNKLWLVTVQETRPLLLARLATKEKELFFFFLVCVKCCMFILWNGTRAFVLTAVRWLQSVESMRQSNHDPAFKHSTCAVDYEWYLTESKQTNIMSKLIEVCCSKLEWWVTATEYDVWSTECICTEYGQCLSSKDLLLLGLVILCTQGAPGILTGRDLHVCL